MERLKAFSVEKFTLDGRRFHTLTYISECNHPPRSTQPGYPSVGMRYEYQLRLGSGKVTVGLASHCPCVTDNSGLPTYGLNGLYQGDEDPTYNPSAVLLYLNLYLSHSC